MTRANNTGSQRAEMVDADRETTALMLLPLVLRRFLQEEAIVPWKAEECARIFLESRNVETTLREYRAAQRKMTRQMWGPTHPQA
jgi:hypothetical protein